jgi:glycosyltransferase involved in cell wall biosynthesis
MRHTVVMVTSSYPRFPGDTVGTFLEPLARSLAARGHEVHVVAPWHPRVSRGREAGGVQLHYFRYAPGAALAVFGYAAALEADVRLRRTAWLVAPVAVAAGWRLARSVARRARATVVHGHWVVPGGLIAGLAAGRRPLVVSLHGSDVYVAERHRAAARAARWTFRRSAWVTACSRDLRDRALGLGAAPDRTTVIPYGVDGERFKPDEAARTTVRRALALDDRAALVVAVGRLVRKKGFEYLIEAVGQLAPRHPGLQPPASATACGFWGPSPTTRSRAGSPPPMSWWSRRYATSRATSTACPTPCSKPSPPARPSSRHRLEGSARSSQAATSRPSWCPNATPPPSRRPSSS